MPRAIELRAAGSYQEALEQLELHNRCDKSPVRMSYYYHLGWTYHEMGRYEEALQAYDNGLRTQPDYLYAYWRRGLAHEALGQTEKAARDYQRAYAMGMERNPVRFLQQMEENPDIAEKLLP
jgi:tetratricopeptide (TPR) repeat protein